MPSRPAGGTALTSSATLRSLAVASCALLRICTPARPAARITSASLAAARLPASSLPSAGDMRYHWVHVRLAAIDEPELRELIVEAWRMCVPKKVSAMVP